ncbi:denticleless protein homolog isoform X2 [Pristis pectinata]|uniref:denticleless protein homolog isoform X2 n=1 Tax=Pristis pectinata TaxID=685728 RepID=UPI00223CDB58|nr:denticleless protein homolog isoform X2 [Pristis pectinata]
MLFRTVLSSRVCSKKREPRSYPLDTLLQYYQCNRQDEHTSSSDLGAPVPPFGCSWSTEQLHWVLAVVNEEGMVRLYNTECHNKKDPIFRGWLAHNNAVFDLAWVPGEPKLVTASGDQTAKLWDVKVSELLGTFKGHQCSLKSVAFGKQETAVFCTGGRDGNIMVWDTRCSKKDGFYRQVKQITGAHNSQAKQTPPRQKKRRPAARGLAPSVDSQQSVTVVIFRDENTLISAGAVDGVIKVWDLRKNYTILHQDPVPVQSFLYPGTSARKLGYSSIILDSKGSNLFANCTDDNIYMFNLTGLKTTPIATFSGHQNSTFYIKAGLSPDDQFLVSGSTDHNAYIWKVTDPLHPPTVLQGHSQEVTSVSWCPSDFSKIATCSDDNTVRIWRLNRKVGVTKSELVGSACQKKPTEKDVIIQSTRGTPPKTSLMEGPKLPSPQQAACAPNISGGMPLSFNTPSSVTQSSLGKNYIPHQLSKSTSSSPPNSSSWKMSIKKWMVKSPCPPASLFGAHNTSRMVLNSDGQIQSKDVLAAINAPVSEKKVKRRLDTSDGSVMDNSKNEECSFVAELSHISKKCKIDICYAEIQKRKNLSTENIDDKGMKNTDSNSGEILPLVSPFPCPDLEASSSSCKSQQRAEILDKENNSPQNLNWLAELGEKQKLELGVRMGRLSTSPTISQNLSVKKKEEWNLASSPTAASMRKISSYFQRKLTD